MCLTAMEADFQQSDADADHEPVDLSSATDLNQCTRMQFRGLCRLSRKYGLFPKREDDAAINIKHIKISTIRQIEDVEEACRQTYGIAAGGAHV